MMSWLKRARVGPAEIAGGVVRPSRDVLTARRDCTAVLLDLRREVYLTLDETGSIIWEEVERGADPDTICRRLAAEFDAPEDVLRRDAHAFLSELAARGLVVSA